MKKSVFLFSLFFAISCTSKPTELIGVWEVNTPYHKAVYSIEKEESNIVGKIQYYNDHTFIYESTGTSKDIFLHRLKRKDSIYVDAISGATQTNYEWVLQRKHQDTLYVTQYIHHKPLQEIWIKK